MTDVSELTLSWKGVVGGEGIVWYYFDTRLQLMELSYALWCFFSADEKEDTEKKQGSDTR